jgi:hypothetical protein
MAKLRPDYFTVYVAWGLAGILIRMGLELVIKPLFLYIGFGFAIIASILTLLHWKGKKE